MKIHISYVSARPKPRVGDRRTIQGVEQIRVFRRVRDTHGRIIGYDCTGGRQRYDWVPLSEAEEHHVAHHLTPAERARQKGLA